MSNRYYEGFNHRTGRNRLNNVGNRYQGKTKTVLVVCSAGLLRSPTIAHILSSPPFNFNTRAAGVEPEYALVAMDYPLLSWASDVICLEAWHADVVVDVWNEVRPTIPYDPWSQYDDVRRIVTLNIHDDYEYRSPELCKLAIERLKENAPDYFEGLTEEINYLNYVAK